VIPVLGYQRKLYNCSAEKHIHIPLGKPEKKIPLGRPWRRWEDDIRIDLREIWRKYVDWLYQEAQNSRDNIRQRTETAVSM
jgi:hypothetical protein